MSNLNRYISTVLIQPSVEGGTPTEVFIRVPAGQIDGLTNFIQNVEIPVDKIAGLRTYISGLVKDNIIIQIENVQGLSDALEEIKTEWIIIE